MTEVKHKPEFLLTKDARISPHTDELWSVYCGDFGEN